jgi:hypothetical protein
MAPHRKHLFTPEGREAFFRLCARIIARRPEIKGLLSGSWYNDPRIREVSPRLAYVKEGFDRLGYGVFRVGVTEDAIQGALARSPSRRRLYEAGLYRPTAYLGIVTREKLLRLIVD